MRAVNYEGIQAGVTSEFCHGGLAVLLRDTLVEDEAGGADESVTHVVAKKNYGGALSLDRAHLHDNHTVSHAAVTCTWARFSSP